MIDAEAFLIAVILVFVFVATSKLKSIQTAKLKSIKRYHSPPDVFILGAAKCGTTVLHHLLSSHPQVCAASTKELHFFDTWDRSQTSLDKYFAQFLHCPNESLSIESTPKYFGDVVSYDNFVASYLPSDISSKKFIVLLRHPIERELSWYRHMRRKCADDLRKGVSSPSKRNYACLSDEITFHHDTFDKYLNSSRFLVRGSLYLQHLFRWMQVVRRDQLFIVDVRTFVNNNTSVMRRISRFLNIDPSLYPQLKASAPYSSTYHASSMSLQSFRKLVDVYASEMESLAIFLQATRLEHEPAFIPYSFRYNSTYD
jgi:hypothetical protein